MRNHGSLMGGIIFLLVSTFQLLSAASVEATLANTEVVQGNMAQLRIVATGNRAEFPNITEVGGSQILGRHQGQSTSFTYINGKSENTHTTVLTLTFAPQQDMTIPSYSVTIDGTVYKTEPIKLKVIKSNAPQVAQSDKFSLLMRADKKSVIVGEPLIATVFFSLQNGVRLSENPQYKKPEFKGFFVKEVEQGQPYNEGNRQVTELKYILTPQSEGNFTLEPATAKIGIADTNRRDIFGSFFGTIWTPIASNTVHIEVKKKPQDTDLVGSFTIESNIDNENVKANKPVNLTVKIEGEGSLEDFELPNYEIDGVTVYSDDAKIESHLLEGKLHSTFTKSFAFISGDDFDIAAQSISVYDIKKDTIENLEIPAYKIKVKANKIAPSVSNTLDSGVVQTDLKPAQPAQNSISDKETEMKSIAWWMLVAAFMLGILVMYLFRYLPTGKWMNTKNPFKESEAMKILYAHMSEDLEAEKMVRKLYAKKNGNTSVVIDKKALKALVEKYKNK